MIVRLRSEVTAVFAAGLLTLAAVAGWSGQLSAESRHNETAERIVSIGGSVTEIVYALGEEDRLIARDTTSVFPEAALNLPDVGYIRALAPEGVMSVDPDLVLMLEGSGPQESVKVLEKSGISIADIPEGFSAQAILDKVRSVGAALGEEEKADTLATQLKRDLDAARKDAKERSAKLRVLFVLSTRGGRILAGGTDTAADGILELSGALNAVSEFSGYKPISDEAVITAQPDVVLMMTRATDHGMEAEELFEHPALALTPAGKNKHLIKMRGQYLLGFGPRTAEAIKDLVDQLNALQG